MDYFEKFFCVSDCIFFLFLQRPRSRGILAAENIAKDGDTPTNRKKQQLYRRMKFKDTNMKKRIILLTMVICCLSMMFAQNNKISYQAVVRDSTNHLVVETPLTVQVTLTDADDSTYSESHSVTSNPNGLISLWIGDGYDPIGNLNNLKWNSVTVESKIYRQSNGVLIAEHTLPLAAVPYALYAENVNKENLSTNIEEYIEEHPFAQVQSDWEENDETSKAYILHKPVMPVVNDGHLTIQFAGQEYTFTANQADNTTVDLGEAIETPQVQSDWEETDPTSKAYILHKPDINDGQLTIQFAGQEYTFTANQAANTTVEIPAPTAMTAADLIELVNGMTDEQKAALRTALGVTGGGEEPSTTFTCGTDKMVDANGNEYETVQIGTQCWTKTNLRTTKKADGNDLVDPIATGITPEYSNTEQYYYDYSSHSLPLETRGYLYNWPAAMVVCPTGWHLPSDDEWTLLTDYVSNAQEGTEYIYRCEQSDATSIAKALASQTGWESYSGECCPGNQSEKPNDATGFSAVPAGNCYGSVFDYADIDATFWSSTLSPSEGAYERDLPCGNAHVSRHSDDRHFGYSVRCLRD